MLNVRPMKEKLLVKQDAVLKLGSILVPEAHQKKLSTGVIRGVGIGVSEDDVKRGDRVAFEKYAGTEVTIDGEELLIVKLESVHGVLEGEDAVAQLALNT